MSCNLKYQRKTLKGVTRTKIPPFFYQNFKGADKWSTLQNLTLSFIPRDLAHSIGMPSSTMDGEWPLPKKREGKPRLKKVISNAWFIFSPNVCTESSLQHSTQKHTQTSRRTTTLRRGSISFFSSLYLSMIYLNCAIFVGRSRKKEYYPTDPFTI